MVGRRAWPVAMGRRAAGWGSGGSPVSTSPPAYQEGRAFPSCTVPIYVSANVPDRPRVKAAAAEFGRLSGYRFADSSYACLLYTSDAADERSSVDLGGRRILKKKQTNTHTNTHTHTIEK